MLVVMDISECRIDGSAEHRLLVIQEFRFNKAPFSEHANIPFHLFVMICIFSVLRAQI